MAQIFRHLFFVCSMRDTWSHLNHPYIGVLMKSRVCFFSVFLCKFWRSGAVFQVTRTCKRSFPEVSTLTEDPKRQVRAAREVCEAPLHQAYKPCVINLMSLIFKIIPAQNYGNMVVISLSFHLRIAPTYITIDLWWDGLNGTRFLSLVNVSFTDPLWRIK